MRGEGRGKAMGWERKRKRDMERKKCENKLTHGNLKMQKGDFKEQSLKYNYYHPNSSQWSPTAAPSLLMHEAEVFRTVWMSP